MEGILNLVLTINESGIINCEFIDPTNGKYFTPVYKTITLIGNNESQNIRLVYHPLLTTFPGRYILNLRIIGLYNYKKNLRLI